MFSMAGQGGWGKREEQAMRMVVEEAEEAGGSQVCKGL